jgi:hypothetical protein
MNFTVTYSGQSGLRSGANGEQLLRMAPDLRRDAVRFDAALKEPLRFREAVSALHDVVINDLTFKPRDKAAYQEWQASEKKREQAIYSAARQNAHDALKLRAGEKPSPDLKRDYHLALKRYWKARRELNSTLKRLDKQLWRKLMPYDPVVTVADDVLFFECFSTDESSYGCLTVDRETGFGRGEAELGTTNVDYSWDLYHHFQKLRTYRSTRFGIDPEGVDVKTSGQEEYREEKIELPDGWLRGLMQLQLAMTLPMRRVTLSTGTVYNLLAFLKRNRAQTSPRAIRFELQDGRNPELILEPWEQHIPEPKHVYDGPGGEPIRIWGRRRLLTLARLLPLAERVDVHLLGTGLPSFWVVHLGNMRLTLGLSGWTANDWTRGSALESMFPPASVEDRTVARIAENLSRSRMASLVDISRGIGAPPSQGAAALHQLALRGQVIHDLHEQQFRWRQVMPMALSDREVGPPHQETLEAEALRVHNKVSIEREESSAGRLILVAKVDNKPCEAMIDDDGIVRRGKCVCGWHLKFGIRNGPCRHIQAVRDSIWLRRDSADADWYSAQMKWAGKE